MCLLGDISVMIFYERDVCADEVMPRFLFFLVNGITLVQDTRLYTHLYRRECKKISYQKVHQNVSHKDNPLHEKRYIAHTAHAREIVTVIL